MENILVSSSVVQLSEHPDYLELVNRVCYYDEANANGVQLDYNEEAEERAKTLINTPVVAKYKKDKDGSDTLGGHEVKRTKNGIEFDTSAVGVHTGVYIADDTVETVCGETKTLKCLFATQRIWTRFANVTKAIERLFSENRLHNSWELKSSEYSYKDGIKHISNYEFIGNCLLGTSVPAYGSASKVLSMASDEDCELMVAEALASDIKMMSSSDIDYERKEDENVMDENTIVEVVSEVTENNIVVEDTTDIIETSENELPTDDVVVSNEQIDVSEENEEQEESNEEEHNETSSLKTINDIHHILGRAVRTDYDIDGYVSMIFPEEHSILVHRYGDSELQFIKFDYRIEGDKAMLENQAEVELTISPLNINSEIDKKNDAILKANDEINELNKKVEELSTYKEQIEAINAEKEKAEHDAKVKSLREYVEKSTCFTKKELESDKVCSAIENLDEGWLKSEIADRLIQKMSQKAEMSSVEASEKKNVALNINGDNGITSADVMKAFFKK